MCLFLPVVVVVVLPLPVGSFQKFSLLVLVRNWLVDVFVVRVLWRCLLVLRPLSCLPHWIRMILLRCYFLLPLSHSNHFRCLGLVSLCSRFCLFVQRPWTYADKYSGSISAPFTASLVTPSRTAFC